MIEVTEAYGFRFAYPANDTAIGPCLAQFGEFARVCASYAAELSAGGTFVDVGANIGAISLVVSRHAARVVAIEAHPSLADLLTQNVAENGLTNIQVLKAAAGASTGLTRFPVPPLSATTNFGMTGFGRPGEMVQVASVALDDLNLADVKVVKIDVEGHELDVLLGATRLLTDVRPHWIVETDKNCAKARTTVEMLLRYNYRVYWLYDPFVTPMAPKATWSGKIRGDLNALGVPAAAPQPRDMVEVSLGFEWPTSTVGFKYLERFGMRPLRPAQ